MLRNSRSFPPGPYCRPVAEDFDVVVVGARCAGAPLAAKLANRGLRVALLDRARFPSDTLSTHIFQNDASRVLADLGVLDRVLATGAPWIEQVDLRIEHLSMVHPWPRRPGDPGPLLSVRRSLFDVLLVDAAAEAGACVRTGTRVTGLVERDGRVAGVRARPADGDGADEVEVLAPLVVGADGTGSAVARFTGASRYNTVRNQRLACWGYYEGVDVPAPTTFFVQRWNEELIGAWPCDSGLYVVVAIAPVERADAFRADPAGVLAAHVAACPPIAAVVGDAPLVGRPVLATKWTSYFRESAGPGWALVGDAGHFKDPSPGQGITDALRQAERLAVDIADGLGGTTSLAEAMRRWWRWRDRDAQEMAWFAGDLGEGGRVYPVLIEILDHLAGDPAMVDRWFDVLNHRVRPSEILTPPRLAGATARLLRRRDRPAAAVLADTRTIVARDLRRRWLNHRPRFGEPA